MAKLYPDLNAIKRLKVTPTPGELFLCETLQSKLSDRCHVFFNPYLDGDRPDIIILKQHCGAVIIEVKDWDLSNYTINMQNHWYVHSANNSSLIRSPFSQVFRYKSNFFELHLPKIGLLEALNRNFFGVIHCFVYFHLATKYLLESKYLAAKQEIALKHAENNDNFRRNLIAFAAYEKSNNYFSSKKKQIERDINLSVTNENIDRLVHKINSLSENRLFTDEIFDEFYRRLSPPEHVLSQGRTIPYDKQQQKYIESLDEFRKIKGVAGCGKTTILAKRAVNAVKRHASQVLILTFNITLKHYIKDKISDVRDGIDFNKFEITNYHQFFNLQANNSNIDISEITNELHEAGLTQEEILEQLYKTDIFPGKEVVKFKTIFIDEIQDYLPEWVKIIRDNFLEENGEMVLFGDQSQNIYERSEKQRESSILQGFGRWVKLTKSYRSDTNSPLINLFKAFQRKFLIEKYQDSELFDSDLSQEAMNFDILTYSVYAQNDGLESLHTHINDEIKKNMFVPNDISIVCSNIELLRLLNVFFNRNEKTAIMFESQDEYFQILGCDESTPKRDIAIKEKNSKSDLEKIRRRKKNFFMQNSGLIKISTIHSFKGLESPTVFCILTAKDNAELVYTAMTRAKNNLIIFDVKDSKYADFFSQLLG